MLIFGCLQNRKISPMVISCLFHIQSTFCKIMQYQKSENVKDHSTFNLFLKSPCQDSFLLRNSHLSHYVSVFVRNATSVTVVHMYVDWVKVTFTQIQRGTSFLISFYVAIPLPVNLTLKLTENISPGKGSTQFNKIRCQYKQRNFKQINYSVTSNRNLDSNLFLHYSFLDDTRVAI